MRPPRTANSRNVQKRLKKYYRVNSDIIYPPVDVDSVLQSRSSVCAGYANLFNALSKAAGIESVLISGWAKGYGYEIGDSFIGEDISKYFTNAGKMKYPTQRVNVELA